MAAGLSRELDLTRTCFLIAGIAGVSPDVGTVGSVAWAEWVVSADARSEIDIRELPNTFEFSGFRTLCQVPWCDGWPGEIGAYHLDPDLQQWAFPLSANIKLSDTASVRDVRSKYPPGSAARQVPSVIKGDVLAGSTWWHGNILSRWATWWVGQWTHGAGRYCMTDNEDFAILEVLTRLAKEGRVDLKRVMVLRAGSNFDRPCPGQQAIESVLPIKGGYSLALDNAYRAGSAVIRQIVAHWQEWANGVPPIGKIGGGTE